jgi:hypothetical protein
LPVSLLLGCPTGGPAPDDDAGDDDDSGPGDDAGFSLSDAFSCESPTDGFARLHEEAAARGLGAFTVPQAPNVAAAWMLASVAASDLDGDGDVDLVFGGDSGGPTVFVNDGAGQFSEAPALAAGPDPVTMAPVGPVAAADLDGDGIRDLLAHVLGPPGVDGIELWRGLGGAAFADPEGVEWPDAAN